jgi:DNA-binding cell septation regulator SpoVG
MAMQITDIKSQSQVTKNNWLWPMCPVDQCLLIREMKVIRGSDGYFLSMPARKLRDGGYQDTAVLKEFERITGKPVTRRISKQ